MADLSKITLPNNTTVNIKDNSQVVSNHRHYDSDIVPITHKVYESTSYYGVTNTWADTTWYFMSVIPDDWNKPWRVKFKMYSHCDCNAVYKTYSWITLTGRQGSISYCNWNERNYRAHSYNTWYPLTEAGFNAGYGHAIGVSIYNSDAPTNSAYYRVFEIDYYDCENCTVTILDTPVFWANWEGTGSTYYGAMSYSDACTRGLCETNDSNDGRYFVQRVYTSFKAGAVGVFKYTLVMQTSDDSWESIITSSTTATSKVKNSHGFKLGQIYYQSSGNNYAEGEVVGSYTINEFYGNLIDHRYSFNTENNSTNGLTANLPVYLVGTLGNDGLFYLADKWWTQTLPTTEDGKLYIRLGDEYDYYRFTMDVKHPVYRYINGALREIGFDSNTVAGHTVASDVPSGAAFTDTTYTFTGGTNKITVTPSTGTASDVTFTASDDTRVLKAGDTMTGDLIAVRGTNSQRKIGFLNDSDKYGGLKLNNSGNNIDFGWDYDSVAGAGAYFRSAAYGSGVNQGQFGFFARSSAGTVQLVGTTGGALTWNNRRVVTSTNGNTIGSSVKPTYVDSSGYVQECTYSLNANVPSGAVFTDTKNTTGSTDTSSKIYLVGATEQAANPQTYSDDEVYATSGVVTTKSVQVGGGAATMQYNSTTKAIDFIFT